MQEQTSGIYNGKIINKVHKKNHQATRSSIPHILTLPSSEGFLVCKYKSDEKKPYTAASSLRQLMNTGTRRNFSKRLPYIFKI